jgi:D-sedoheptulose 7-phosphate isomerase
MIGTAMSRSDATAERGHLRALAAARFARSIDAPTRFFDANTDAISRACREMAARFERGGRLLAFGAGAQASDAVHVAVEFTHPVLVGKRALAALALAPNGMALRLIGGPNDIAIAIASDDGRTLGTDLEMARAAGMLTIALVGARAPDVTADFVFAVDDVDAMIVQEVHETLYHVLWELVHVFFEHRVVPR